MSLGLVRDSHALWGGILSFPTYISIGFHVATEHEIAFRHGLADSVAQVPYGPVIHSKVPLHLARRHPFLCFKDNRNSHEPLRQRQMGIVEYSASGGTELMLALRL